MVARPQGAWALAVATTGLCVLVPPLACTAPGGLQALVAAHPLLSGDLESPGVPSCFNSGIS